MKEKWFRQECQAVILDLDGVITQTARLHAKAWKTMFDQFLKDHQGEDFSPFTQDDYETYVDGKPRYDGVRSFLESRNISLEEGKEEDKAGKHTVYGLGKKKNELFQQIMEDEGVDVYEDTIEYIEQWKKEGKQLAVVSSSKNCRPILKRAGLMDHFEVVVDGITALEKNLNGKPAPDIFLDAAREINVEPKHAVVFEDALAGVEAGRRGDFGMVVGVDRDHESELMKEKGADMVISSLRDFGNELKLALNPPEELPSALDKIEEITYKRSKLSRVCFFFDFDGTLSPITHNPEEARLDEEVKKQLRKLSELCPIAIVSGRDRHDIEERVGLPELFYAGSHGFDIKGPKDVSHQHEAAREVLPQLDKISNKLEESLQGMEHVHLERKKYALAVHYRGAEEETVQEVRKLIKQEVKQFSRLRWDHGKQIFEVKPDIEWHKGKAVLWILENLGQSLDDTLAFYLGDDITDEDAFKVLQQQGIAILVEEHDKQTFASYRLHDQKQVSKFIKQIMPYV
ncbi:MAG: trehalose-phosphatase [Cyclobacteriaceae bacterium]